MKLTFLGSRGNHATLSSAHLRHSSLLVEADGQRVMLDCGKDWDDDVLAIQPDTIILTHAHDDHAGGIGAEIACPVYATAITWRNLGDVTLKEKRIITEKQTINIGNLQLGIFKIHHSHRAPAVAIRISTPTASICYAPDIAGFESLELLQDCSLYIGDGSSWDGSLLRIEQGVNCGHAPIPDQLDWCQTAGVKEVIFTHCGANIIQHATTLQQDLVKHAAQRGITASFARDGLVRQL